MFWLFFVEFIWVTRIGIFIYHFNINYNRTTFIKNDKIRNDNAVGTLNIHVNNKILENNFNSFIKAIPQLRK